MLHPSIHYLSIQRSLILLSVQLSIIHPSIYPSIHPSIHPSIIYPFSYHSSFCLSNYPSSIHLSIHLFVHPLSVQPHTIPPFTHLPSIHPPIRPFIHRYPLSIHPLILQIFTECLLGAGVTVMNEINKSLSSRNSSLVRNADTKLYV